MRISRSRLGTCCAWPLVGPGGRPKGCCARSLPRLGLDIGIPDHTTFSRCSPGLSLAKALALAQRSGPVHVVTDSTGLKVYGAGAWLAERHGERGRRTWRKLHLAVDPESGEILASALTTTEEGDAALVGPLLDQITGSIASVTADGAYMANPFIVPSLSASLTRP
jgi:hypothetical protein